MKHIKKYESSTPMEEVEDSEKRSGIYKQESIEYTESIFKMSVFGFIDDFIEIEDLTIDVDISFVITIVPESRKNYPKNANINKSHNVNPPFFTTQLLQKRSIYERPPWKFEYGLTYTGYPYIKEEDILRKNIIVHFSNSRTQSTKAKQNLHFLNIFKEKINMVCDKYNAGSILVQETMAKIGYTSCTFSLNFK